MTKDKRKEKDKKQKQKTKVVQYGVTRFSPWVLREVWWFFSWEEFVGEFRFS